MPRRSLSQQDHKFIRRQLVTNFAVYLFIGSTVMIFGSNLVFTRQPSNYAQSHSVVLSSAEPKK
jgi:hypothetical protein